MGVVLAIGTMKGAWFARPTDSGWHFSGPSFKGWQVNTFGGAGDGSYLLTTGSSWYGAAIHRSDDLSEWTQIVAGPAYGDDDGPKLTQIWTLAGRDRTLFAGVAEAGLFRSDDDGTTWSPVNGFNQHPTRGGWEPGLGGLTAHRILLDSNDAAHMWVGVSAVGVFETADAGVTWDLRNEGLPKAATNEEYSGIGYCVHCLVADPSDPNTIWRQDHAGVFRTTDGGRHWDRIETGLPAGFGFPIDRDPVTGRLFVVPLESDEFRLPVDGELAVYGSDDGGDSWEPKGSWSGYDGVLRDAMTVDGAGGVYLGTTGGRVVFSSDSGDNWAEMGETFPRILSLHAFAE